AGSKQLARRSERERAPRAGPSAFARARAARQQMVTVPLSVSTATMKSFGVSRPSVESHVNPFTETAGFLLTPLTKGAGANGIAVLLTPWLKGFASPAMSPGLSVYCTTRSPV